MKALKKVTAIALTAVMFLSGVFTGNSVQASGTSMQSTEYIPIVVGEKKSVSIAEGGQKTLFSFVPEESGIYILKSSSLSYCDTVATLYQNTPSGIEQLVYDDDGAGNGDFLLQYSYVAGQTYILEARLYDESAVGEFNVVLTESPITSIEIEDMEIIENTNMYETGPQLYMYTLNSMKGKVVLRDGTTKSFSENGLYMEGNYYSISTNAWELQYEERWVLGGTYQVTGTLMGVSDSFTVKIVESPIERIDIQDISIMEYSTGSYDGEKYIYSVYPSSATIIFKDGTTQSYHGSIEVYNQWHSITVDCSSQYEEPWEAGKTYEVTGTLLGVSDAFNVTIKESLIKNLEIEDITIVEYSNGYSNGDNFIYNIDGWNLSATVKLKNGDENDIEGYFTQGNVSYSIAVDCSSQYEGPWEAGKTYEVTGTLLGVSDTFNVTIVKSPIKSITLTDIVLREGFDTSFINGFEQYHISPVLSSVLMSDGTTADIKEGRYIFYEGMRYEVETNGWDIQYEEPWEAGKTYQVTGTLLGASATFNVTIEESPIESIVLEDIVLFEGINSYSFSGFEEYFFSPILSSVLLKDGTFADIDTEYPDYIIYEGEYYSVSTNSWDLQYEEHWEVGKTYEVTGTLLGVRAQFNVTIQKNPIKEIEILTMPERTDYLIGEWCNLKGMSFRIQYEDGSSEDIVIEQQYTTCYWGEVWSKTLDRYDYISLPFDFTEAGRQDVELQLFGKTFEIPVTVKENLIESISIRENVDKSIIITVNNSDHTSYEMTLLDIYCADWGTDEATAYVLFTDKGSFESLIFDNGNSFAIGLGDLHSENIIKSNSLSNSEWYETVLCFERFCSSILPGNMLLGNENNSLNFNGEVTEDNIDRVIGTAFYMSYSREDEDVVWEGDYATISGERIRKSLEKYFALENIDLTMSESYDAQSDTYELFDYIRASWMKNRPMEIKYRDGIWSAKVTYLGDEGTEMTTYLKLNKEQKIMSYRVNVPYIVADVDGDGEVNDWDGVILARHLAGWDVEISSLTALDIDGDGEVNDWDGVLLDRYLAGWDIQIGGES